MIQVRYDADHFLFIDRVNFKVPRATASPTKRCCVAELRVGTRKSVWSSSPAFFMPVFQLVVCLPFIVPFNVEPDLLAHTAKRLARLDSAGRKELNLTKDESARGHLTSRSNHTRN